jgi:hypothetical protein
LKSKVACFGLFVSMLHQVPLKMAFKFPWRRLLWAALAGLAHAKPTVALVEGMHHSSAVDVTDPRCVGLADYCQWFPEAVARPDPSMHTREPLPPPASYTSPNDVLRQTAVLVLAVTSDPELLARLVNSLTTFAPWLPLIVAVDSGYFPKAKLTNILGTQAQQTTEKLPLLPHVVETIHLPAGAGIGYGRNRLVQAAKARGFGFIVMADSGLHIPNRDLLPKLAQLLVSLRADVVAPHRCAVVTTQPFESHVDNEGRKRAPPTCHAGQVAALVRSNGTVGARVYMFELITFRAHFAHALLVCWRWQALLSGVVCGRGVCESEIVLTSPPALTVVSCQLRWPYIVSLLYCDFELKS